MRANVYQPKRSLQANVEKAVERFMRPYYISGHERPEVSANDQGEVWVSCLVTDRKIAEEVAGMIRALPGVQFVTCV